MEGWRKCSRRLVEIKSRSLENCVFCYLVLFDIIYGGVVRAFSVMIDY